MPLVGNAIDNNVLASLANRAGPAITSAIHKASLKTGVNFAYLMQKADTESSFDTDAKAHGSSAKGLYQFISSTWMHMVKKYGDKYGLGDYADKIGNNGKVSSSAIKKEILALRDNPEISALMAGEYAAENKQSLINSGIREKDIGSTELYLAHFMGAGGASEFIKTMKKNPLTSAADIFPQAARANHNIFYTKTQRERSVGEIYAMFDKKFVDSPEAPVAQPQTMVASNQPSVKTDTETDHIQYASNSIMRTLPMAATHDSAQFANNAALIGMLNDDDNSQPIALNQQQRPIPLPLTRNNLVSNPATLMALADNNTGTAQSQSHAIAPSHPHVIARRKDGDRTDSKDDDSLQNIKMAYMARINYGAMNN